MAGINVILKNLIKRTAYEEKKEPKNEKMLEKNNPMKELREFKGQKIPKGLKK